MRYEDPDSGAVSEISREFNRNDLKSSLEQASPRFQMSAVVAEYAEILRESYWAQEGSLEAVISQARRIQQLLSEDIDFAEFTNLVIRTERIQTLGSGR